MIVPRTSRLSASATVTSGSDRRFSPMTWLLVTTYPSLEMITPDPRLNERRLRPPNRSS